jgi:hypothetical protein
MHKGSIGKEIFIWNFLLRIRRSVLFGTPCAKGRRYIADLVLYPTINSHAVDERSGDIHTYIHIHNIKE